MNTFRIFVTQSQIKDNPTNKKEKERMMDINLLEIKQRHFELGANYGINCQLLKVLERDEPNSKHIPQLKEKIKIAEEYIAKHLDLSVDKE